HEPGVGPTPRATSRVRTGAPPSATVVSVGHDGWPPRGVEASPWFHQQPCEPRIVLVNGRLDDALAAPAVRALLNFSAPGDAPIELHVDSPEGTLEGAFALIDALGVIRAPVRALCRGLVGTPAIGVVAATGHRMAVPHARFRLTQPTAR